jgi:hypothetical protein
MPSTVQASHSPRRAWPAPGHDRPLGVGDQPQMVHDPTQPVRVQTGGRLDQGHLDVDSDLGGRSWVPWATTRAWAGAITPSVKAAAVAVKGPRNNARPVRTAPAAAPPPTAAGPAASRPSTPAADRVRPRPPPGVDPGQLLAPLALQPLHNPAQLQHPLRQSRISPSRSSAARASASAASRSNQTSPAAPAGPPALAAASSTAPTGRNRLWSNVCSSPWRQPINPQPKTSTNLKSVDNCLRGRRSPYGPVLGARSPPPRARPAGATLVASRAHGAQRP